MRISVIIPVFNEEKHLEQCLESLLNQEEKAFEIIVVNNNSTDKSAEIASKFPIKILHQLVKGIIPTRNAGFNAAKGDIIARCDADTIIPTDWTKRIRENFENNSFDGLSGSANFHDISFLNKSTFWHNIIFFYCSRLILGHHVLYGPNMAITKKIWGKVKNETCTDDMKVHEDVDLAMHISKYGKIKFDTKLVVSTSSRRLRTQPYSFFIEYPSRWIYTMIIYKHPHLLKKHI